MGWRDLLQKEEPETLVAPWVGGRNLQTHDRHFIIEGKLPKEHGWYEFKYLVRKAWVKELVDPDTTLLGHHVTGYLVGDRLVPDDVTVSPNIGELTDKFEQVSLIEPGLDKFVRVKAGRIYEGGDLIFDSQEFPLGPEDEVLNAFLNEKVSIDDIAGVTPALDGAFKIEDWYRVEVRKRREEERKRRELEEKRRRIREALGDGEIRREMAKIDFGEAARAALAVGGAEYVDHRKGYGKNDMIVRYRVDGGRYECVCHKETMRIIDAGICLTDHATGIKNDNLFTLESLPTVIKEGINNRQLVIWRHA